MAPSIPRSTDPRAQAAFGRGDFAAVRRLAPTFVARALTTEQPPQPLFAPQKRLLAISAGTMALLTAAWIYALLQR